MCLYDDLDLVEDVGKIIGDLLVIVVVVAEEDKLVEDMEEVEIELEDADSIVNGEVMVEKWLWKWEMQGVEIEMALI